jgi:hypothetical protein
MFHCDQKTNVTNIMGKLVDSSPVGKSAMKFPGRGSGKKMRVAFSLTPENYNAVFENKPAKQQVLDLCACFEEM